jgi:hypothetical protein
VAGGRVSPKLRRQRESDVQAENLIWIFGSARTGSTWLASVMGELDAHAVWEEPLVGALFGDFYYGRARHRTQDGGGKNFILGSGYEETWLGPMRDLILGGAAARFRVFARGGYLIVKEPNGSIGAPLLMKALPESRVVLLVRDPRDVVASAIDARRQGSWRFQNRARKGGRTAGTLESRKAEDRFAGDRARTFLEQVTNAVQAFEAHGGPKCLLRYEELRADTLETMRRLYARLGIEVDDEDLARAVEKHSWERIPEEQKGEGKFFRKATPGGWREDLTAGQARTVEDITAPLLDKLYPGWTNDRTPEDAVADEAATGPDGGKPTRSKDGPRKSGPKRRKTSGRITPANVVWIFGTGRTGSSWIVDMMGEMTGQSVWFEPRVGTLFDEGDLERGQNFILHPRYKQTWRRSIRNFVLDGAEARFPEVGPDDYLMVKEPSASRAAPLLMEALPESRLVLLVRDPRDVVASWLDAGRKEGWQRERKARMRGEGRKRQGGRASAGGEALADRNPEKFVKTRAQAYLENVGHAKRAFDAHQGAKVLIRYEELRTDTLATMRLLYARLGIEVDDEELARAVDKHSWERIPAEQKGEGKFFRKATPGGWREDLTPRQAKIVERITQPLLEELYPDA